MNSPINDSALKLAGQLLVVGFEGEECPPPLLQACKSGAISGAILFKRNLPNDDAALKLNHQLKSAATIPLFLAVDQEGGQVARIKDPKITLPPARQQAKLPRAQWRHGIEKKCQRLKELGFNLNFAPVLDVDSNPLNPIIGDRAFSESVDEVIDAASFYLQCLEEQGMISCGKHFPGHGNTTVDSHLALPRVESSRAEIEAVELAPFRALCHRLPSIMTAHVVFPAVSGEIPATQSPEFLSAILREQWGYQGVVFSDDLEMAAIADFQDLGEAAILSINAGCDQLLVCHQTERWLKIRESLASKIRSSNEFRERCELSVQRVISLKKRFIL